MIIFAHIYNNQSLFNCLMKKLIMSLVACAAMFGANANGTWVLGPYNYTADTIYHATAGPGITTTAIRLSSANGANKTNIFYSTIDLTNPDLELRGVQPQDKKGTKETVKAMGDRKNDQGNGQYITGVNGDFFNLNGSPTYTNGHSMIDGTVYNLANGGEYWHVWASYAVVEGAKDIRIQQNVAVSYSINFPDETEYPVVVNGWRGENVLVLFTSEKASTETNQWGSECTMKLVSGSLDDNNAVFEVTSAVESGKGNMTVPADGYVLSGNGTAASLIQKLKTGDNVSLGTLVSVDGNTINPNQIVGGCSMIVMNGELAPENYFDPTVIDHFATNQARTVIGYNKDRTQLILLVADKYSSCTSADAEKKLYGASTGMLLERMGHIMLHLGCYTAMNFDGGGSSQLYNKEFGIRNVPYGSDSYRPVANGFFAVSTTPEDYDITALEVRQKNVSLDNGEKFTPIVYGYNKYGVLVNKNVKGFTLSVAPSLGTVSGTTFTAGNAQGSTIAVVSLDGIKCGIQIHTNGGGAYATSGDDNAPIMVAKTYTSDEPLGIDREQITLTERWHFVNPAFNDSWDGTAPNWASDDAIKAKSCPRFATALNGKFYTVDMKTMSIAEVDAEGNFTPKYKLPSLEGRMINGMADYYGAAISRDDAGNFLIGHLFTKTDTYRVWTVYNPNTGKAKHFEINIGNNPSSGRIDNIGRVVGDMMTDAYAYVAPKATGALASQCALILHFEGDGTVESVEATPSFDNGLWLAGVGGEHGVNTFSICQPKYTSVEAMAGIDPVNTFYWYSKTPNGTMGVGTADLFTRENGVDSPNYALNWNNRSGLNGFDTFTLGGKRYFAVNYAAEGEAKSGQHIIVMDEQSIKAAEWINPDYTSGAGYNTITAVPVSPDQVDIYVYNCTGDFTIDDAKTGAIAGTRLTLSIGEPADDPEPEPDDPSTGIDDITADDAPAIYYNLQGVEVKNPVPGVYIVRRGTKVTKQLLR